MINEPTTLLTQLEQLGKTNAAAAHQRDALARTWRDYRWTILEVLPSGDLSTRKWRDAHAFELPFHGYGWDSAFAVVFGEFTTGSGAICTSTSGPRHDWPRYAARNELGVRMPDGTYEDHRPVCDVTFVDLETALQNAITAAQQYLGGT